MGYEHMTDSQGLDWLEVHFDDEDGALESVWAYCPLTDEYIKVAIDDIPSRTLLRIEAFVETQIEKLRAAREAV